MPSSSVIWERHIISGSYWTIFFYNFLHIAMYFVEPNKTEQTERRGKLNYSCSRAILRFMMNCTRQKYCAIRTQIFMTLELIKKCLIVIVWKQKNFSTWVPLCRGLLLFSRCLGAKIVHNRNRMITKSKVRFKQECYSWLTGKFPLLDV